MNVRRAGALLVALALAAGTGRAEVRDGVPANPFAGAAGAYVVQLDGKLLWAEAPDQPLPPASLTKLMTALIVVEAASPDAIVAVGSAAARAGGARMGLAAGERLAVRDLLAGMLLRSGNDACLALAMHVAGTENAFVTRMNARATLLGLASTHFVNACGFDAAGHRSSARDLAALTRAVLASPLIADLVARREYTVRTPHRRNRVLTSTNALVGLVPGLRGVKTGYTTAAGRCLIGRAVRGEHEVLVVLLGARDRWWDAVAMIEQAFERAAPPAGGTRPSG